MATKPDRVVIYNEELSSIKSHDSLIMWSSDFDFSYPICRFRMQIPNSSPTSCCVYLLSITPCNCLAICFLPSSRFLQNIGEFGAKKHITDHRTADKTQFVVVIKRIFFGLFFF